MLQLANVKRGVREQWSISWYLGIKNWKGIVMKDFEEAMGNLKEIEFLQRLMNIREYEGCRASKSDRILALLWMVV